MNNSIYPCIGCDGNAREMSDFYCATFSDTKVVSDNPLVIVLEMSGQKLMLLNGGHALRPNPAISLMRLTASSDEVETLYAKLIDGGTAMMPLDTYPFSEKYAWVEDRYGVSWQLYTGKAEHIARKIVPTLMFIGANNGKAKEAAAFYMSVFPNSAMRGVLEYTGAEGEMAGNVQHGEFFIDNFLQMMMDSSFDHKFSFSEGISLVVECNYQEEIDHYWKALSSGGGEESVCGWVKDKYGVSWQIVPSMLGELTARSPKVMDEVLKMKKFNGDTTQGSVYLPNNPILCCKKRLLSANVLKRCGMR